MPFDIRPAVPIRALLPTLGALSLMLGAVAPAHAQTPAWPTAVRGIIQRLGAVEWRLRQAAGAMCPRQASAVGIVFDDADAYAAKDLPLLRETLGLGSLPQVAAVAEGSPAALAGLHEGDELVAIGGRATADLRAEPGPSPLMTEKLEAWIATLPQDRPTELAIRRAGRDLRVAVTPVSLCAARFILKTEGGIDAFSDGDNLAVTARMVAFTQNDDELALVTGHELGHIVARDDKASGVSMRRAMEDRADLLGVRLAACAGYNVQLSFAFWERYNKRDWKRWLRDPSHRSVPARLERMRAVPLPLPCPLNEVPALKD